MTNFMTAISIASEDDRVILRQPWPEVDLAPDKFISIPTPEMEMVVAVDQIPILLKWLQDAYAELTMEVN